MQTIDSLNKNLNPEQKKAVEYVEGPLLILAGAGSGKTRVLTHRAAFLLAKGLAAPDQFLAVTFTNKAAGEMEARIYGILTEVGVQINEPLWISTFHSLCSRILRSHIELLDYKSFFTIYDTGDQLSLVKRVMAQLNINDKVFSNKAFLGRISSFKQQAQTPDDVANSKYNRVDPQTLDVYRLYEAEMKKANALDFDDLLVKTYELFRMYPDILSLYQNKFKYIMVDEYQDTNRIQYLLVKLLSQAHRKLCVVGDEDQSIYSWRGADISNILNFEKDFPEAQVVKLEENYRSTKTIVTAASHVIKNNTERKDKTLFTSNPEGDLIQVKEERNEYEEARYVVSNIADMMARGEGDYSDYAVFYRTNAQSRVVEEQLRSKSIPYRIVGGVKFYERMEIKDILSYLKLIVNESDDMALKRIINTPTRGIGKTTVDRIEETALSKNISMYHALPLMIDQREFNAGTIGKLRRFYELIENIKVAAKSKNLSEVYHIILDMSEYVLRLKAEDTAEAQSRIENLEELDNAIDQFISERGEEGTLVRFLEEMALVSDSDDIKEQLNAVTLMTLHVSKGLEYPFVFIVGMEEGLFPSNRGEEDDPSSIEEERRLAYVGMTRARKKLFLTYAQTRRIWGTEVYHQPSRFIKEIPKQYLKQSFVSGSQPRFMQTMARNGGGRSADASFSSSYDFESQAFPDYDEATPTDKGYSKGQRVKHPTFGAGSIYQVEGSGDDLRVSVMFNDNTIKKFVAKYARLEKI